MRKHPILKILADNLPDSTRSGIESVMATNDWSFFTENLLDRHDLDDIDPKDLFDKVFINELFRKADNLPLGIDTAKAAVDSFLASEAKNTQTNKSLKALSVFVSDNRETEISSLVFRWREQVRVILRQAFVIHPRVTTGATYSLPRGNNVIDRLNSCDVTENALAYLTSMKLIAPDVGPIECHTWKRDVDLNGRIFHAVVGNLYPRPVFLSRPSWSVVEGNMYDTVPKTALTDRGIAKEPTINITYQGGLGANISSRLSDFGLVISERQEMHREMVAIASLGILDLATIDLSAASDSVTTELCKLILPSDWLEQVMALRSPKTYIPSGGSLNLPHWHINEMVSSMGNGFTFELETLLFLSLMLALSGRVHYHLPENISVYGDDIIIPSGMYSAAEKALNVFGFSVNKSKSYAKGFFYESCGADYYKSINIRGFNAKAVPNTNPEWIRFINGIRRSCFYSNGNSWRRNSYRRLWLQCIQHLDPRFRVFGPRYLGDSVINTEDVRLYGIKTNRFGHSKIKTLRFSVKDFSKPLSEAMKGVPSNVQLMAVLSGGLSGSSPNGDKDGTITVIPKGIALDSLYRPTWTSFFFEEPALGSDIDPVQAAHAVAFKSTGSFAFHHSDRVRQASFFIKKRAHVGRLISLLRDRLNKNMVSAPDLVLSESDFLSFTL